MIIWTGIIILPVTLILWIMSYLLVVKRRVGLIAGFDPQRTTNRSKYAVWIGYSTFLCGLGLLLTWGLIAAEALAAKYFLAGITASATLCIILAVTGSRRFAKR